MDTNLTVAYGSQITAAATRHHLDPRLLAAVAAQETGGPGSNSGRNIVGDGGHGHGLFQIDDRWHAFARTPAAMDPAQNADYAAGLIGSNLQKYGSVRAALSAYNSGSPSATGSTTDWGDGRPVGYADSVLRHYAQLGGTTADPRDAAAPVDALRSFASALAPSAAASTTTGASTAADSSSAAGLGSLTPIGGLMTPSLPPYHPLPQADGKERDVAPSSDLGDDSD